MNKKEITAKRNMKEFYYYRCSLCGEILSRDKKVKKSFCDKQGKMAKLKRLSKRFIKRSLTNCGENSQCEGCIFDDEKNERCIYFDGNE